MTFAKFLYNYEYIKLNGFLRDTLADNAELFYGLAIGWILLSYIAGSLNFAIIMSKAVYHDDIRTHGSGNAGFTNMKRTFGTKAAIAVIVGDLMKTILSVTVAMLLFGADIATLAGLACIFGHCFPLFYKFKGGKGVAALAAMVLVLDPIVFLVLFALFAIVVIGTKYLSLGSIMAMVLYPLIHNRIYTFIHADILPEYFANHGLSTTIETLNGAIVDVPDFEYTLLHTPSAVMVIVAVFMALFGVIMHRTNIRRIWNGTENRFYISKKQKEKYESSLSKTAPVSRHRLDELDEELSESERD
ncbi:MAG: glycerol-3-phosphate 1-O-acyltransferase PlsY [Clostridia bacterium]|nr:glycerol-3-phosphate 1-O-acyltransferase PlsY [Clostridia bacterium]